MSIWKSHPLLSLANGYLVDSPQDLELTFESYLSSLFAIFVVSKVATMYTLAMLNSPNLFYLLECMLNNGWLMRYLLFTLVSLLFMLVYSYMTTELDNSLYSNAISLSTMIIFFLFSAGLYYYFFGMVVHAMEPQNMLGVNFHTIPPLDYMRMIEPSPPSISTWLNPTPLPLNAKISIWENVKFWGVTDGGHTFTSIPGSDVTTGYDLPCSVFRVYPNFHGVMSDFQLSYNSPHFSQHSPFH